jgi:hypothetical protein
MSSEPEFLLYTGGQKPCVVCKCNYKDTATRDALKGVGVWNAAMKVWTISGDKYERLKGKFLDLPDSYLQLESFDYKKQDKSELAERPVTVTGTWHAVEGGVVYQQREKLKELGCIYSSATKSWLVPNTIYDDVMRTVLGFEDHVDGDTNYPKTVKKPVKKSPPIKPKKPEPESSEEETPRPRLVKPKKPVKKASPEPESEEETPRPRLVKPKKAK